MADNEVGTLVVVEANGPHPPIGIITDRDIAIRGVASGLDLDRTPVSQIMTTPVQSVNEATPIEQALARMASAGTRRLLVTGDRDRAVGILSLDDVLHLLSAEAGSIGRLLGAQLPHVVGETAAAT
jgi:signal-transduction protein with cAMP-binding, CBS, and nucleotidyltransferase domain